MWEDNIIKSANHFGEICKYIQFLSHSAMAALITASTSRKGNPAIIDRNHFKYVGNGTSLSTVFWRCSNRKCGATLTTRKSTGNLVGKDLPDHTHGNQLLEKKAQETENDIVAKYAGIQGALPSTVLQEISHNMLASEFPGQLSSASSSGAIRMKLWRQRQIINPRPVLPSTFKEYMETNIPEKFTKCADNGEFMIFKEYVDQEQTQPLVIFMSQWAADILKNHTTWMFDGTFKSAPTPFSQVTDLLFYK